jgi:transcriptional regulator with XRE-family HTH domain
MPPHTRVLGDFLRARRSALQPREVGIIPESGRRVAGLRREEIADRAGISLEYYVRLEQGRYQQISDQVLASLARALVLDDHSREYLYRLALHAPTDVAMNPGTSVSLVVLKLMKQWANTPAYIFDRNQDILVVNELAAALSPGYAVPGNNLVLMLFTATDEQRTNPKWRDTARATVAALRFHGDPTDPRLRQIVGDLSVRDRDFRRFWADHEVRPLTSGVAPNFVPGFGWVDLAWQALEVPGGHFLNVKVVEPNTPAAAAVEYLSAILRGEVPGTATFE